MSYEKLPPEWNNIGTEPPQSKKDAGFEPGEKPPAQWVNWLINKIYLAVKELQEKAAFQTVVDAHIEGEVNDVNGVHGLKIVDGTFTPTLIGLTTAGVHTYSVQKGTSRKIGNRTFIDATIALSAKDPAMDGSVAITVPFEILTGDVGSRVSFTIGSAGNIIYSGTLSAVASDGYSYINLHDINSGVYAAELTAGAITNNTIITISGNYYTLP